jgi:pimeloyl-ACP methyl ester carboxylesterase
MRDELQLATAAFFSTQPMVNRGSYSTNLYFQVVADFVATMMLEAGVNPDNPVLFCGHSLGGVASCLLAAEMSLAHPDTDIRLMTLGCPRPGDQRLRGIISTLPSVHVVNTGDIVTQLPPIPREWIPFTSELLPQFFNSWNGWADTPNRMILRPDGVLGTLSEGELTFAQLIEVIGESTIGPPFPSVPAHEVTEYVTRLGGD